MLAERGPAKRAFVQPRAAVEDADGRSVESFFCLLPPDVELDAWAYLRWNGVMFEIGGSPGRFDTLDGSHHVEASLRRVR